MLLIATEICAYWKVLKSLSIRICRQYASSVPDVAWEPAHWTGHASVNQVVLIVHNCSVLHCRNLSKVICLLLTWHLCLHPSIHLTKVVWSGKSHYEGECLHEMLLKCNKYIIVKEFKSTFNIKDPIWNATTAWEEVKDTDSWIA